MMLGAHALRAKAERKEREKRDQRAKEIQKAAKRLGEAAHTILGEKRGSTASSSSAKGGRGGGGGGGGNRAHSIYDFATLSARTPGDKHPQKNAKLKSRFSLNVGSLNSAREQHQQQQNSSKNGRNKSGGSFQSASLLLTPRSISGSIPFVEHHLHLQQQRARAGSAQSTKSGTSNSSSSAFTSAGTRLLRWLGILSPSSRTSSATGSQTSRSIIQRRPTHQQQQKGEKCKRRLSAM